MNNRSFNAQHLKFLFAAIILLVVLDQFVLGGARPYIEQARQDAATEQVQEFSARPSGPAPASGERLAAVSPEAARSLDFAHVAPEFKIPRSSHLNVPYGPEAPPQWRLNAMPAPHLGPNQPKVAIIIDDMGVSRAHSLDVLKMDYPLTLAFLPYAAGVADMAAEARRHGHELLVHMPMEPLNGKLDTGPIVLKEGQSPEEFAAMLDKGLAAFSGYVGMNNHMGSRLTQDKEAMEKLMAVLKKRGLLFLDSKTIAGSVAAQTAAENGVPYAVRDVFLDDDPSLENVRKSLRKTQEIALKYGQAIAIGHPKDNTIAGLKEWLPTLKDKGITLVPLSALAITTKPSLSAVSSAAPAAAAPPQAPALRRP